MIYTGVSNQYLDTKYFWNQKIRPILFRSASEITPLEANSELVRTRNVFCSHD